MHCVLFHNLRNLSPWCATGEWVAGSAGMGFTPHVITIAIGEVWNLKCGFFSGLSIVYVVIGAFLMLEMTYYHVLS